MHIKFSPHTGYPWMVDEYTMADYRALYAQRLWNFNPFTGAPRDAADIMSDPFGLAIVAPGEPLKAATIREGTIINALETALDDAAPGEIDLRIAPPSLELPPGESVVSGDRTDSAPALLDQAAKHMRDRAATYDKPEGERSMGKTIAAFNAITGRDLRESEGWLLMAVLKMVRSETREEPHRDSIEDEIAYSALYGEARIGGR